MGLLVWEIRKRHGWASMRGAPSESVFYICCIHQVGSGLWMGGYVSGHNNQDFTHLPGEYPLEELKAILETTITLLEAQ